MSEEKKTCFMIMPLSTPKEAAETKYKQDYDHFIHLLEHLFIPAIKNAGFEPIDGRAEGADLIHARIIENLATADLVLCDMSLLNANVFFELGVRTSLDLPVCFVRDEFTRPPFDVQGVNYHVYQSEIALWSIDPQIEGLSEHIKTSYGDGRGNAMWKYFGLQARANLHLSETGADDKTDLILLRLTALEEKFVSNDKAVTEPEERFRSLCRTLLAHGLTYDDLARETGLSNANISRLVKKTLGPRPPRVYLEGILKLEAYVERTYEASMDRHKES